MWNNRDVQSYFSDFHCIVHWLESKEIRQAVNKSSLKYEKKKKTPPGKCLFKIHNPKTGIIKHLIRTMDRALQSQLQSMASGPWQNTEELKAN